MASFDAGTVIRYIHPDRYGVHRAATFGDHRERLKDLAVCLGFTLIEEDV